MSVAIRRVLSMSRGELAVALSDQRIAERLSHLSLWPREDRLDGIDLNLGDRSRVSALPWRGQFSPETVERLLGALAPTSMQSFPWIRLSEAARLWSKPLAKASKLQG